MLKNNKMKLLISSIIILLPMLAGLLLWNRLPDSFGQKGLTVFGLPLTLLAGHWGCLFVTSLDKKQRSQNPKALSMIFWIIPFISLYANGITYCAVLGRRFDPLIISPLMTGILFLFIGNYLPKTKQNRTLGIRIPWTLNNEENWTRTHRFGGKVWFVCGLILVLSVFLPGSLILPATLCVFCAAVLLPIAYSYGIYRQHRREGISYVPAPKSKNHRLAAGISIAVIVLILLGTAALMFTGDIEYTYTDDGLTIKADYWPDLTLDYAQITSAEYRTDLSAGARTNGFGSARLLMGTFNNGELGTYTRYSYTASHDCIVLKIGTETLVLGAKDDAETRALYETILSHQASF